MDGTLLLPDHPFHLPLKCDCCSCARGVNRQLTTGRPLSGVHNYPKSCIWNSRATTALLYNGALVQKAADGSTVAQTALSYDDYRFLEKTLLGVGSHFPR